MKHRAMAFAALFGLAATTAAIAAVDPAADTGSAPLHFRLLPTVQLVHDYEHDGEMHRRTTIVARIVADEGDAPDFRPGDAVVIDWTVNLDAQRRAEADYTKELGGRSGWPFLREPDPPTADAEGLIWAHLAPAPDAAAPPIPESAGPAAHQDVARRVGPVLVPAANQYSFDPPANEGASGADPAPLSVPALLASGQRQGRVTVHGCMQAHSLSGLHLHPECGGELDLARSIDLASYNRPLPFDMQDGGWKCVVVVGDWRRYAADDIVTGWASKNGLVDNISLASADGCTGASTP